MIHAGISDECEPLRSEWKLWFQIAKIEHLSVSAGPQPFFQYSLRVILGIADTEDK